MSTPTEVKAGLDAIAQTITNKRADKANLKSGLEQVSTELAALATDHADLISTVNGYPAAADPASVAVDELQEQAAKVALANATVEFTALKAEVDASSAELT